MKNSLSDISISLSTRNISDRIANEIKRLISEKELKPGQKLPTEKELSDLFSVGRTSVREAKRILSTSGLIVSKQGTGTFVAENADQILSLSSEFRLNGSQATIQEVFEGRRVIETGLAALAAENATKNDLDKIKTCLDQMKSNISDLDKFVDSDLKFHLAIVSSTKNNFLGKMYLETIEILKDSIKSVVQLPVVRDNALAAHRRIFRAIKDKDPGKARATSMKHLDEVWNSIKPLLNGKAESDT